MMSKFFKVVVWLIILIGLGYGMLSLRPAWIGPLPGVRLEPALPPLDDLTPQPGSAFAALIDICGQMPTNHLPLCRLWQEDGDIPLDEMDMTNLVGVLVPYQPTMEQAHMAVSLPQMQVPVELSTDACYSYLSSALTMVRALNGSALLKASRGNYKVAFGDCLCAMEFGRILTHGTPMIHRLVAVGCTSTSLQTIRRIALGYTDIPDDLLRSIMRELEQYEQTLEPWGECLRYEAFLFQHAIQEAYSGTLAPTGYGGGLLDIRLPAPLLRIGATLVGSSERTVISDLRAVYAHYIDLAERPYSARAYEKLAEQIKVHGLRDMLLERDTVGHILAALLTPSCQMGYVRDLLGVMNLRLTRAMLAIACYQRDQGALPPTLEALVPAYLDAVPIDPFDGRPLRYRIENPDTWLLYSVGRDGRDDGGAGSWHRRASDQDQIFSSAEYR